MYVCICNAVTDGAVREAAAQGVRCVGELTMRTGCGGGCGACVDLAKEILQESARQQSDCACCASAALAA